MDFTPAARAVGLDEPLLFGFAGALGFLGQCIQRCVNAASGNLVAGEQVPEFAGDDGKLAEVPGLPFAHLRLVEVGLAADDVDFEFLEVGEDGDGDAFVPGVAFGLKGIAGGKLLGGFLGLADEAVALVGPEQVIGAFASAANLRSALNLHFALALDEASAVLHVPAERAEKGVEVFEAQLGLVVAGAFEFGEVAAKLLNEAAEFSLKGFENNWRGHREQIPIPLLIVLFFPLTARR